MTFKKDSDVSFFCTTFFNHFRKRGVTLEQWEEWMREEVPPQFERGISQALSWCRSKYRLDGDRWASREYARQSMNVSKTNEDKLPRSFKD